MKTHAFKPLLQAAVLLGSFIFIQASPSRSSSGEPAPMPGPVVTIDNTLTTCNYNAVIKWRTDCPTAAGQGQSATLTIPASGTLTYTIPTGKIVSAIVVTKYFQVTVLSTWSCSSNWSPAYVSNGCGGNQIKFVANGNSHRISFNH